MRWGDVAVGLFGVLALACAAVPLVAAIAPAGGPGRVDRVAVQASGIRTAMPTAEPSPTPGLPVPPVAAIYPTMPAPTPSPTPMPAPPPPPQVTAAAGRLTLEELDYFAAVAGWTLPDWLLMRRIISECENIALDPKAHNGADPAGGSHGLAQLNGRYWFDRYGEDFEQRYDPVVNLRTALKLYQERGRFGGSGGWACAGHLGIP